MIKLTAWNLSCVCTALPIPQQRQPKRQQAEEYQREVPCMQLKSQAKTLAGMMTLDNASRHNLP